MRMKMQDEDEVEMEMRSGQLWDQISPGLGLMCNVAAAELEDEGSDASTNREARGRDRAQFFCCTHICQH